MAFIHDDMTDQRRDVFADAVQGLNQGHGNPVADPFFPGPDQPHAIGGNAEKLLDDYVRVYDAPADAAEMERRIRRHKAEFGQEIIFNEVDHIGITRRGKGYNEWSELESLAYSLVSVAQNNDVPILAYSQTTSELEQELVQNNIVVYNKDFRGSRGLRNAVDIALVGCKHNGIIEGKYEIAYRHHSVIQMTKNRRTGRQYWGVYEYEPVYYRLTGDRNEWTVEDRYG